MSSTKVKQKGKEKNVLRMEDLGKPRLANIEDRTPEAARLAMELHTPIANIYERLVFLRNQSSEAEDSVEAIDKNLKRMFLETFKIDLRHNSEDIAPGLKEDDVHLVMNYKWDPIEYSEASSVGWTEGPKSREKTSVLARV